MQQPPGSWGYGPPPPPTPPPVKSSTSPAVVALAVVAVVGAFSMCMCVSLLGGQKHEAPSPPPSPSPASDLPDRGEIGYLWAEGTESPIGLYPTKEALDASGGHDAKAKLAESLAKRVLQGTRAKMIGGSLLYKEVEIIEGHHRGARGWIPKEFAHKRAKR